jgi:hypothetical protein
MEEEKRYLDGKSRDVENCLVLFDGSNIIYKIILYLLTKNRALHVPAY